MNARALLAALSLSCTAAAQTEIAAFTKDGASVVYLVGGGPEGDDPGQAVVLDLHTGAEKKFTVPGDAASDPTTVKGLSPELDAWLKKHPVVPAKKSRTSPDGKASAEIFAGEQASEGAWEGGAWQAVGSAGWELQVVRGGKAQVAARCGGGASVTVYWSPDGRRTVWVVAHGGTNMRDPGYSEVIVGTDGAPAVAVLAPNKEGVPAAQKLLDGIEKAGFPVLTVAAAKQQRPESVVFAAAGREAEAKSLAAAVPGGAKIEKLNWDSAVDLVVALGPKAVAP